MEGSNIKMEKEIIIHDVGNAGVSFTNTTNTNIIKIAEWLEEHKDETMTYAMLQEKLEIDCGISSSNTRMYSPFLLKNGFAKYDSGVLNLNEFFTNIGKSYVEILKMLELTKNNELSMESIILEDIKSSICVMGMINRKDVDAGEFYLDWIKFCNVYKSINMDEFYMMVDSKEKENFIEAIKEDVENYRKDNLKVDIKMKKRNRITGADEIVQINNNIFSYTRVFLEQCNLIEKVNDRYILNEKKRTIIDYLVK
jgi:uncharacterized protein YcgL (UPF0745 family)